MKPVLAPQLYKLPVMNRRQKWVYRLLVGIGLTMTLAFAAWWFQPEHISSNFKGWWHLTDVALFAIVTYVVWYQIFNELFAWKIAFAMRHPEPLRPARGAKVAFVTAFVPGSEPYNILEQTLKAMSHADYPHDTWLLDEGDDFQARDICYKYGVKHYSRKGQRRYNMDTGRFLAKSKGGNYNSWYDQFGHAYDFVAQIDVDFIPRHDFLTKTLGYFRDPNVAFVGTPQVYGNIDQSWIARGAAEQAYSFFGPMQKGFFGQDMQLFIGANHVVRVAAHQSIGGYAGHIVEDHLTGMHFYVDNWKSVYVPEALAIGEGPSTWEAYFSQQMRWAYGLFDILFTHSPRLMPKMKRGHVINYLFLQQFYFYGLAQALGIVLLTLYFVAGIDATAMSLLPILVLYLPLIVWQQLLFLWLQRFNIDPKHESGLMLHAKLLSLAVWPIYLLALVGAIRRKRLTYKVTQKGTQQAPQTSVRLFWPHFVIGTITAFDLYWASLTDHQAAALLFWAALNTVVMYYFVANALMHKVVNKIRDIDALWFGGSLQKSP